MAQTAEVKYCYRHPDRETGLSCSECGRPICYECMTPAAVGLRCPDHSGRPQGVARVATGARRASFEGTGALLTKVLIAINVGVFLLQLAGGSTLSGNSGTIFERGALVIRGQLASGELVGLAEGEWYRLISAAFLHHGIIHLGFNMLALWWFGAALEAALGRGRFLLLYVVSGLAGSAGALLFAPESITVGASGAIFGILGAALVLERQKIYVLGGSALGIIVLNLAFTFFVPNISIGGHLGGLAGGALGTLALSRFGRGHAAYGAPGLIGIAGLVAVGVLSLAVAYVQVGRYT
jgi:membrane associated rhomboid family serine protease